MDFFEGNHGKMMGKSGQTMGKTREFSWKNSYGKIIQTYAKRNGKSWEDGRIMGNLEVYDSQVVKLLVVHIRTSLKKYSTLLGAGWQMLIEQVGV